MSCSWVPENGDEILSPEYDDEPAAKRFCASLLQRNHNHNCHPVRTRESGWKGWSKEEVAERLIDEGLDHVAEIFKREGIKGKFLKGLTISDLEGIGICTLGNQLEVMECIEKLTSQDTSVQQGSKVFNDPIHGHIELHPLCVKIIDTPQFQRLRFLKQLGTCYFVYPGASHNRFEHCLGVCYLAGRLVSRIQRQQPYLGITDEDVLCVQIAGLCHDLGHGPFSHLFDNKFIPAVCPDSKWKHEEASVKMFEYLVRENQLEAEFRRYGLTDTDQIFITEQIAGGSKHGEGWTMKGRPQEKSYLYEVVANKRNGIDVDKWDYFARDCHMLGIKNNFDHNRCIHFARVLQVEGELQICSRDKEIGNIYDMFYTRTTLHRRAYQHKTTNIIENMVVEALVLANDHIKLKGGDGKMLKMSEAIHDMTALSQLTDDIFSRILHSHEPELERSREILRNILTRKLYKCVSQIQPKGNLYKEEEKPVILAEVVSKMDPDELASSGMTANDIVLQFVNLDYGMKEKNPVDNVRFYSKENPNVAVMIRKEQESSMLPENFKEQVIRIYSKKRDQRSCNMVKVAFEQWCAAKNFPPPKGGDVSALELTPVDKGKQTNGQGTSMPSSTIYSRDDKERSKRNLFE